MRPPAVVVDSSAILASLDAREPRHEQARLIASGLRRQRTPLILTDLLRAEAHALVLSRLGREPALELLDAIERGSWSLERVSRGDEVAAVRILRRFTDKTFSFTDATTFALMDRLGIEHAFSFDRHFRQYGLTVLEPHDLS